MRVSLRWVALLGSVVIAGIAIWNLLEKEGRQPSFGPLSEASLLMLVETDGFDSNAAIITTFERTASDGAWRQTGVAMPARAGRAGVGWGHTFRHLAEPGEPIKKEGDKRAPAGVFKFGRPFGHVPADFLHYMQLDKGQPFCVDDAGSEKYSQIVDLRSVDDGTSGERMWEIDLYKRGIVVDYPTDRAAKSGSCIFLHVWKNPETPTAGCVATSEESVARLQKWVGKVPKGAAIAIVPRQARDRLGLELPD